MSTPAQSQGKPSQSAVGAPTVERLHRYVDFTPKGDYQRYGVNIRVNHFLTLMTFIVAVATGIPLYFHNADWARAWMALLGGSEVTGLIHRVNAVIFILNTVHHFVYVAVVTLWALLHRRFDHRRTIIPRLKDLKDVRDDFKYFLGYRNSRPPMEKFSYKQKLHYWAIVWGNAWLIVSGLCLWMPEVMVNYLPNPQVTVNVLRLMHAEETLLATLVVFIWHIYNVHLAPGRFPWQWAFLTGRISKDHQIEEHYLEYRRLVAEGLAKDEEAELGKS